MALLSATALTITSCSDSDRPSGQPPLQSSPPLAVPSSQGAPSAGTNQPASPRDAVIAAYRQYWDASQKAAVLPEAQAREVLAPVSTPGVIDDQIRGIRDLQAKNREPWGRVTVHVYAVDISGSVARLSDCQDVSQAGLADARTHQLIPGTRGGARPVNYSARLHKGGDGRWRVSAVKAMEAPCTLPTNSAS